MQLSLLPAILAVGIWTALVQSAAVPSPTASLAPALPISAFEHTLVEPLTLTEIVNGDFNDTSDATPQPPPEMNMNIMAAAATCTNPRVRTEWDSYSTADRTNFVTALQCLMKKGQSGQYSQAKNRYEDLVALHQTLTNNVHNNAKFLLWHRYFLWTFEDVLRSECGFTANLPWFDETKYAGRFSASSIFSKDWFGGVALGGGCVKDGVSDLIFHIRNG
jgi:tyrosinase